MTISLIAAVTENNVIGRDGGMPWHLPEDLKYFKQTTLGHTVIMGRKTWDSLGKYAPLPDRTNIVVSRNAHTQEYKKGAEFYLTLSNVLKVLDKNKDELFVIGGGQIYQEAISLAKRLYLTRIHATIEGDTFFPDIPSDFKLIKSTPGQNQDPKLTFEVWEK